MKGTALLLVCLMLGACDRPAREKKKGKGAEAKKLELASFDLDKTITLEPVGNAEPLGKQDRVVVELTGSGEIKHRGKVVSLDGLTAGLMSEQQAYDAKMKERGTTGTRLVGRRTRASKLYVLLRIDQQAPWQHAQWLLAVCAENKFDRTQFAVDGGKLDAFLPTDAPVPSLNPADVSNEIVCSVHIVARKEKPVKWGPPGKQVPVLKPSQVVFRLGARQAADVSAIGTWVEAAREAAKDLENATVIGQIKAGHKVSSGHIVDAYARMRDAGLEDIQFPATAAPGKAVRKLKVLPFPKTNYGPKDDMDPAEEEVR